ncbi:NADPH:adrenodoxin oxidoreductase [Trypanosoma brucei equiperdum]|uniref:NADPH:adrenodoxin oxidoreductase n=1 Tax=Trypanosoma brucei equiperdum TaxID=630700 RepID=A0A3L6KX47_9TRYP|nr:NADPH:adrenodoxin oxidoreductase [Trypanosoma brucei equiperdum]
MLLRRSHMRRCLKPGAPRHPPLSCASASPLQHTDVTSAPMKTQIAVVGSGPSGCYVAQQLIKKRDDIHVDVFERLPVPFGLCRYGVAPDHPEVKNVEQQFLSMFKSGRVTWIGNVDVGRQLPIDTLLNNYAAVVLATGVDSGKKLNIPGEDLGGVVRAADFVRYYNTYPFPHGSPRFCPFQLGMAHEAVVIGNGNVALDCTRVLAASYKYFCPTDMNCAAIKEFMKNHIHRIHVVGRRGPEHSAFTIAEFRELTKYQQDTVRVTVDPFNPEEARRASTENPRARQRLFELMGRHIVKSDDPESQEVRGPTIPKGTRGPCHIRFRYNMRPLRFLPHRKRKGQVGAVVFECTAAETSSSTDCAAATETQAYDVNCGEGGNKGGGTGVKAPKVITVPCDLVITSLGYYGDSIPGVEFDHARGVISHVGGRVKGQPRLYCTGWAKNGPKGIIAHALMDAQVTAATVLEDLDNSALPTGGSDGAFCGKYGLVDYFVEKRMEPVSVAGLERIMHVELERGVDMGKRLEKIDDVRAMLDVALGGAIGKKANNAIRGIMNERPDALLYLNELLDDTTDLAPLARQLARDLPPVMAEQHPPGRLHPSQL